MTRLKVDTIGTNLYSSMNCPLVNTSSKVDRVDTKELVSNSNLRFFQFCGVDFDVVNNFEEGIHQWVGATLVWRSRNDAYLWPQYINGATFWVKRAPQYFNFRLQYDALLINNWCHVKKEYDVTNETAWSFEWRLWINSSLDFEEIEDVDILRLFKWTHSAGFPFRRWQTGQFKVPNLDPSTESLSESTDSPRQH